MKGEKEIGKEEEECDGKQGVILFDRCIFRVKSGEKEGKLSHISS